MGERLIRNFQRWHDAEARGLDDQADAAFGDIFRTAMRTEMVPVQFTAKTMEAVRSVSAREARRARRTRLIVAPVAALALIATIYFSAGLLISGLSAAVVGALNLLVAAVVGIVTTIPAGADLWTILTTVGRAAAAILATPAVTVTILAIQGIAIAALVALQRLLRSDRELLR